jgi:hypothetical protein
MAYRRIPRSRLTYAEWLAEYLAMLLTRPNVERLAFVLAAACAAGIASVEAAGCTTDNSVGPGSDASGDSATQLTDSGNVSPTDSGGTDDCLGADASYDPNLADAGMQLVLGYGCAKCHQSAPADAGLTLEGQTSSIKAGQMIYPKNLTPDRTTGLGCWTEDQMVNAILNAIDDQNEMLCVMPQFATRGMDAGSAHAIANFLRSLPPIAHDIPESVCPGPSDGGDGG